MKNILNKIKINYYTYYFLILCFFCGLIKNVLILFMIVILHEIGHVITTLLCKYKIEKVEIFPFGGITTINKLINSSIIKDILIAISGVLFQYTTVLLITNIYDFMPNTLELINYYNKTILVFNLLPIIPLDGSKILEALFNKLFSYKLSYYLTVFISIIGIILFINYNVVYSLNNYLIVGVLIFNTFKYFKEFKYTFNKFLLERIMYDLPYKRIENNTKNIKELKKERLHYFKINNKYINEKEKIAKKFDKDTYF